MRIHRKRGEQLLSCQREPLNLPADLLTIVPAFPIPRLLRFRLLLPSSRYSLLLFAPRHFVTFLLLAPGLRTLAAQI